MKRERKREDKQQKPEESGDMVKLVEIEEDEMEALIEGLVPTEGVGVEKEERELGPGAGVIEDDD